MLEIKDLVAGYGAAAPVLNNISFSVPKKSVTALMGRNGSGKTTLCRTIFGLVQSRSGTIHLGRHNLTGLATYRIANHGLAYVPQERSIFDKLTVEENLYLALHASKVSRSLNLVWDLFPSLHPLRRRHAGLLSGGEQQLLAVARALSTKPKLIVFDEPSQRLQPSIISSLSEILREVINITETTVLLAEQNLDLVQRIANKCIYLMDGRISSVVPATQLGKDTFEVKNNLKH